MKKTFAMSALAIAMAFGAVSCKKKVSDADLTTKATTVIATNPTASVEVKEGTAHLSGTYATEAEKESAIAALKAIEGVKDVHDMATIAPVETVIENVSAVAPEVVQKVKDALKDFPSVTADVVNGELTLSGNVSPAQARKIKESVDALKVGKVNFNYTVK